MATVIQGTINPVATTRALGESSSTTIKQTFPASPIHQKSEQFASVEALKADMEALLLNGVIKDGWCFSNFNRDYVDAPNVEAVDVKKHNLASPWVPNPTSPGPGSMNPTDQPAPPEGFGQAPNDQFGVGVGSQTNPKSTSEVIASQKPGDLPLGKSSNE